MNWIPAKIDCQAQIFVPQNKELQDRVSMGLNMMLHYKAELHKTQDPKFAAFLNAYEKISHATILDYDRAFMVYQYADETKNLIGNSVECGVFKGGCSALIASCNPRRKHYAFDTYDSFPPDAFSEIDRDNVGEFDDIDLNHLLALLNAYSNIIPVKGAFADTFNTLGDDERFSFVYIDADLYESTKQCCGFFYSRITTGGVMLFDDYLVPQCPGVKKAVDEFCTSQNIAPIILPTFQAVIFKR